MIRYVVFGAGMMGRAVAFDLHRMEGDAEIVIVDRDGEAASRAAEIVGPRARATTADVSSTADVRPLLEGASAAVGAVSYTANEHLTRCAIDAGVHFCDLGGNNDVVDNQHALDREAAGRGVLVVPNCGLAPGLVNVLAVHGARRFGRVSRIRLRVGGLPQHPVPPLNYQIVFSIEGLINEYTEPSEIIRDGKRVTVPSMTGVESLEFPPHFNTLEAFHTSGGLSTLARTLEGTVESLDYKTIRYPGHCDKMRTLLDLGFASYEPITVGGGLRTSRELFIELLRRKLPAAGPDVVLARVSIEGARGEGAARLEYELVDYYDKTTDMSAMMRTTAYPTSIVAQMLARGIIRERGVRTPEACVPGEAMIEALALRGISITEQWTTDIHL